MAYTDSLFSDFEYSQINDVKKIIMPLQEEHNINFFLYTKIYWNFTYFRLCNHKEYMHMCDNTPSAHKAFADNSSIPQLFGQKYIFASDIPKDNPIYTAYLAVIAERFDITSLVLKIKYSVGATEIFCFGAPASVNNFERKLVTNEHNIDAFIFMFKNKMANTIAQGKQAARLRETRYTKKWYHGFLQEWKKYFSKTPLRKSQKFNPNRFYLETGAGTIYLTKKEMCALCLLVNGNKYQKIAEQLSVSIRTVHTHFDNIKLKFNCNNRMDLLTYLNKHNLSSHIREGFVLHQDASLEGTAYISQKFIEQQINEHGEYFDANPEFRDDLLASISESNRIE